MGDLRGFSEPELGLDPLHDEREHVTNRSGHMMGFSPETFALRRKAALGALEGSVLVLPSAPLSFRSRDTEARYRADSDLFYLTGVVDPGAVAVLRPGGDTGDFILFVRPRDSTEERWSGERLELEDVAEVFGADAVYSDEILAQKLPELLAGADNVYFRLEGGVGLENLVTTALSTARLKGSRTSVGPYAVVDPGRLLDRMRLLKDPEELDRMRRAAEITVDAFSEMLATVRIGLGEWQLEASIEEAFRRRGAMGPAFPTIVGSGANACILHYRDNSGIIGERDLVLVDAGAELDLYAADVTRTFPASGSFTDEQCAIYDVVLAAHQSAIQTVRPGATIESVHDTARNALVDGLLALNTLCGNREELIAEESHKPFFPHQTSHWLGLDVHDVGAYCCGELSRALEPGMVLTVEPGLYFPPSLVEETDYSGIGVRIEDDVVVTPEGYEVITEGLPVTVGGLEDLIGSRE